MSEVQPMHPFHLTTVIEIAAEVTTKIQQNLTAYMAHMRKRPRSAPISPHTDRV